SAWRGEGGAQSSHLGTDAQAQLASAQTDDSTRGVGSDTGDAREPLPAWLEGRDEWSGLAYMPPPEDSRSAYGTPSLRALVRRATAQGRAVAVLVTVPVSRALVKRFREDTSVNVRPFFIGAGPAAEAEQGDVDINYKLGDAGEGGGSRAVVSGARARGQEKVVDFRHDQFGDAVPEVSLANFPYPVIIKATDWTTGTGSPRLAFVVDWSWAEGGKQFW